MERGCAKTLPSNFNKEDVMDRGRWKKLIDWMMIRMVAG